MIPLCFLSSIISLLCCRLYVNWRFLHGIEAQFLALQKGFNEVIPQHLLKAFDEKELEVPEKLFQSDPNIVMIVITIPSYIDTHHFYFCLRSGCTCSPVNIPHIVYCYSKLNSC